MGKCDCDSQLVGELEPLEEIRYRHSDPLRLNDYLKCAPYWGATPNSSAGSGETVEGSDRDEDTVNVHRLRNI